MARRQAIEIRRTLKRLLPTRRIRECARAAGAFVRERKVDPVALVWAVLLGFTVGNERTLAGLRRAFEKTTGTTLVPSAFYTRFSPGLAKLFKHLLRDTIDRMAASAMGLPTEVVAGFRDVMMSDSTVIRLHQLLERAFPACRTNHTKAALKAHVILSVTGRGPASIKVTSERTHDGPVLRAGAWVKDRLLLFDLGYYRFQLFACIERQGGYFVTRLKDGANPLITAVHRVWRGRSIPLVGQHLQDVVARLAREEIDVEVELCYRRRSYRGQRRSATYRCRLVGVRDTRTGTYHFYLTNIPANRLDAQSVASTYGARWLIELAFRQLKSHYRLDQMPSRKRHIVETLLYAAFLTMFLSRELLAHVRSRLRRDIRVPDDRWAALFAAVAQDLLALVVRPASTARLLAPAVDAVLLREAPDPNRSRRLLGQRALRVAC